MPCQPVIVYFDQAVSGRSHALPDLIHVVVYKTDNTVVVFRVGIAHAPALYHTQVLQRIM